MTAKAQGQGASALVDLTDVSGTPDAGKTPVSDGAGMFPFTDVATQAELDAHVNDATDAHDASAISILDTANDFTATEVEGALAELQTADEADEAALAAHLADATDAHDASAISVVPFGSIAATNTQAALEEIVAEAVADLGPAVILAPASSARNVIQPTAGAVIAAIVKAHAAQSVDIFEVQNSAGDALFRVGATGSIGLGPGSYNPAAYGGYDTTRGMVISRGGSFYDANGGPQATPGATDQVVLFFPDLELLPTADNTGAHFAFGGSTRLGATTRRVGTLYGNFAEAMSLGVRPSGTEQIARALGVGGWAGTYSGSGDITLVAGMNGEVVHLGTGVIADSAGFYVDPQTYNLNTGPITRHHGVLIGNQGRAGIATSYGIRVLAQSGAGTATYAVVVEGGKSLFTSGLVIALIAAPADAAYANGEGGWWWDQANSLPKWKGKKSDGTVVNATPYVVGGTGVAIADGGTGSSTASGARTNLGLVIGTDVPSQATFDDHSARHELGGADAIKLDDLAAPDDNTDLDASTSKHGLMKKLPGGTSTFLRADGSFATPAGGSSEVAVATDVTSDVVVSATVEASADTIIALPATTYTNVPHIFEFFCSAVTCSGAATALVICFFDGSTEIKRIWQWNIASSTFGLAIAPFRYTPSAGSHTFSIRGFKAGGSTFSFEASALGSGPTDFFPIQFRATIA